MRGGKGVPKVHFSLIPALLQVLSHLFPLCPWKP